MRPCGRRVRGLAGGPRWLCSAIGAVVPGEEVDRAVESVPARTADSGAFQRSVGGADGVPVGHLGRKPAPDRTVWVHVGGAIQEHHLGLHSSADPTRGQIERGCCTRSGPQNCDACRPRATPAAREAQCPPRSAASRRGALSGGRPGGAQGPPCQGRRRTGPALTATGGTGAGPDQHPDRWHRDHFAVRQGVDGVHVACPGADHVEKFSGEQGRQLRFGYLSWGISRMTRSRAGDRSCRWMRAVK